MLANTFVYANSSSQNIAMENLNEYNTYEIDSTILEEDLVWICYITVGMYDSNGDKIDQFVIAVEVETERECTLLARVIQCELNDLV